jgi:hypothetical protein
MSAFSMGCQSDQSCGVFTVRKPATQSKSIGCSRGTFQIASRFAATCWLSLPVMSLIVLPAVVQAQFDYQTYDGGVAITGYTGTNANVIIPATIDGLPVTTIGFYAFSSDDVENVTLPDSVTNIERFAFSYCASLTNVNFSKNLETIGGYAFSECVKLAAVTIPSKVKIIESAAFELCSGLGNVTLPQGVAMIGDGAFYSCRGLTSINLPESLTLIGSDAFSKCGKLGEMDIPRQRGQPRR